MSETAGAPVPGTATGGIADRLGRLDTCAVSDALDSLGMDGVITGVACLTTPRVIAGSVVTVRLAPAGTLPPTGVHLGTRAITAATAGQIIVVANEAGTGSASWGGLLSLAATRQGVAGLIVDGAVRDVDEATQLEFPIFARGAVPRTARGRTMEIETNGPISVCGIEVNPGDYALADGTGVVIVPAGRAAEVVEAAERVVAREAAIARAINEGVPVTEAIGRNYEDMLKSQR